MQYLSKQEERTLTDHELANFCAFLAESYGLHLNWYNSNSLKRRLKRAMQLARVNSLPEMALLFSRNRIYFERFVENFTVQVTELFREPLALKELRTSVFPFLHRILKPKILLVGSSTGEELISICIMLHEAGLLENSRILATDIAQGALDKSKELSVSKTKIEHAEMNYLKSGGTASLADYYQSTSSMCFFDPQLIRHVNWSLFDLTQSELGEQFDLILCKNVLIYFNHQYQGKPLTRLEQHLVPGGFLALGEQESMAFYPNDLLKMQTVSSQYKIYRKSLQQL